MKLSLALFLIPMAAALVACEGDAARPGSNQPAVAVADADLAVPADFESEAKTSITPANYKAELDALDKEISAE